MLIAPSPLIFNHALHALVSACVFRMTDVHLNISFSQVNINIQFTYSVTPRRPRFRVVCLFHRLSQRKPPPNLSVFIFMLCTSRTSVLIMLLFWNYSAVDMGKMENVFFISFSACFLFFILLIWLCPRYHILVATHIQPPQLTCLSLMSIGT